MEENQIGTFIRNRRLELGMTQQQLADRLGITDKAVSKWERCVSYPDITLLRELAEALDVSVTELLAGERDSAAPQVPPEVEVTVVDTVAYAETARRKNKGWRFWLFIALTAGCLIAALVSLAVYPLLGRRLPREAERSAGYEVRGFRLGDLLPPAAVGAVPGGGSAGGCDGGDYPVPLPDCPGPAEMGLSGSSAVGGVPVGGIFHLPEAAEAAEMAGRGVEPPAD